MPIKILIIGNISKEDSVLMRKKFVGSGPYQETWYSFGVEFVTDEDPQETFKKYIKDFVSIDIAPTKNLFWDTEVKQDHDGITKQFIYLDLECEYVSGELIIPKDHENIDWIPVGQLSNIDIAPPSMTMFKMFGYLK